MLTYLLPFVVALLLSILFTPVMRRVAYRLGCVHYPKKISIETHKGGIPYLGGIAIFLAFALTLLLFLPADITIPSKVLIATLVVIVGGVLDDVRALSVPGKLVAQIGAVSVFLIIGLRVLQVPAVTAAPFINYLLAFVGIVGIINAVNFLDIMDGLAGGVSAIAALGFGMLAIALGHPTVAVVAFILAASTIGFVFFNFNPARVFMGDTGSQFLGFMLAILPPVLLKQAALIGNEERVFLASTVLLGIPLFEIFYTCSIRVLTGKLPWKGSKDHFALRAFAMGYSVRRITITTYIVGVLLALTALSLLYATTLWIILTIGVLLLVTLGIAAWLSRVEVPIPAPMVRADTHLSNVVTATSSDNR